MKNNRGAKTRVDPKVQERVWAMLAEMDPEVGDSMDFTAAVAHMVRHDHKGGRCCALAEASVFLCTWQKEEPITIFVERLREVLRATEGAAKKLKSAIKEFGRSSVALEHMVIKREAASLPWEADLEAYATLPWEADLEPYATELKAFCLELRRVERRFCDYGSLPTLREANTGRRGKDPTTVIVECLDVGGFSHPEIGELIGVTSEQVRDRLRYLEHLKEKRKKAKAGP